MPRGPERARRRCTEGQRGSGGLRLRHLGQQRDPGHAHTPQPHAGEWAGGAGPGEAGRLSRAVHARVDVRTARRGVPLTSGGSRGYTHSGASGR